MLQKITEIFTGSDIWVIIIKLLITTVLSAFLGLIGTLIGKIVVKNKRSKIYEYADKCVKAAEIKFPNEGKKMGPEKMAYVIDQLAIKFPKIKSNSYLYNIAEAAVYELNRKNQEAEAIREFEERYGEKPLALLEQETSASTEEESATNEELSTEEKLDATNTKEKEEQKITADQVSEEELSSSDMSANIQMQSNKVNKLKSF